MIPIVILAITVIAAIVVAIVIAKKNERLRTEAVAKLAQELGLEFYLTGNPALTQQLAHFHLFSQGGSRKINNMIHGDAGNVEIAIFDYQFVTSNGKQSQTHRTTLIYFKSIRLHLTQFSVSPEFFFHKIGKFFGMQDINFQEHPLFSSAFLLQGGSEAEVRSLFRDDVRTWFANHKFATAEGRHDELLFYYADKRIPPHEIQGLMQTGFELFELVADAPATEPGEPG